MEGKENISSILEAINEINTKPKKNTVKISEPKISIPKLNQNLAIPPDVDKLINEAEKYKKKVDGGTIWSSESSKDQATR